MQDVIDVLPEAAAIVGKTGEILAANRHFAEAFGYTVDELVGQKIELLVPLDFRENHVELREAFMSLPARKDFGKGFCLRGLRKSGSIIGIDVCLGPLEHGDTLVLVRTIKELEDIYNKIRF
jgi:PAS domain S-box-containing protein